MARRRRSARKSKTSALRSRWSKLTAPGKKYSWLSAKVRSKPGKKIHKKGHAWTGRKGSVLLIKRSTGKRWATNPGGAAMAMVKDTMITPFTSLPKSLPALVQGSIVKNVAFAGGGALTGLVGGTALQSFVMPLLAKIPGVSNIMSGGIAQRGVGAIFAVISGSVVAKVALKPGAGRTAFITGTAAAALVEAIFPGRFASLAARIPVIGNYVAVNASPVSGLAGLFGTNDLGALGAYVTATNYDGSAPQMNGLGAYVSMDTNKLNGLGAYVQARNYQGTNGLGLAPSPVIAGLGYRGEQLAGMGNLDGMGSNMPSHLDG